MTPRARRFASLSGTAAVVIVAAIASYDHMRELCLMAGQSGFIATLVPFSVDGLVLVGSLAMVDGRLSMFWARLAFVVGVLASLAANILAADPTWLSRAVYAWSPLALFIAVEVIASSTPARVPKTSPVVTIPPKVAPVTVMPARVAPVTITAGAEAASSPVEAATPVTDVVTASEAPRASVERPKRAAKVPASTRPAKSAGVSEVARLRGANPGITVREIASRMNVSGRTVRRYMADLQAA